MESEWKTLTLPIWVEVKSLASTYAEGNFPSNPYKANAVQIGHKIDLLYGKRVKVALIKPAQELVFIWIAGVIKSFTGATWPFMFDLDWHCSCFSLSLSLPSHS